MSAPPEFNIGDTIYLKSSAAIGKLEAFRISGIKQDQLSRWLYRIDITKKSPSQQLVGDEFDARITEAALFYTAEEFLTVCEAFDDVVLGLEKRITSMQARVDECSEELAMTFPPGSKFDIGNTVYIDTSARLGFLERSTVKRIFANQIQPGASQIRYNYNLNLRTGNDDGIFFRESELLTFCEATTKSLNSLNLELVDAIAQRAEICGVAS